METIEELLALSSAVKREIFSMLFSSNGLATVDKVNTFDSIA